MSFLQNQVNPMRRSRVIEPNQPISNIMDTNGQQAPQAHSYIENIPIQKYYIDYEPIIEHEQIPYERTYQEYHKTIFGNTVPVTKIITDYQTIQHTNYQSIQVPYTDYKQVEHRTDYIPHVRYDTTIEHIPMQKSQQQSISVPINQQYLLSNGQISSQFQNVNQVFNVPKQDFIAQQRIHQFIDYEAVQSSKVIAESTVNMPTVHPPQPSSVVIQNSIHETNTPSIQSQQQVLPNQTQFNNYIRPL